MGVGDVMWQAMKLRIWSFEDLSQCWEHWVTGWEARFDSRNFGKYLFSLPHSFVYLNRLHKSKLLVSSRQFILDVIGITP